MKARVLSVHPCLNDFSRLLALRSALWQGGAHSLHWTETIILLGCGALSAVCVLLLEFKLQMPGHAILRAVFAMSFGLAVVPRLGAGTLMGAGAMATAAVCGVSGFGKDGLGSLTSLCLTGPCLDLGLRYARSGPWVYVGLMAGGLFSNLSAFAVQYTDKVWHWTGRGLGGGGGNGGGGGGGRSLANWLAVAMWTYPTFGILAGLLSAVVWFRFRDRQSRSKAPQNG